jgi:hypothetical protein
VISSSQGRYIHTGQHKRRTNAHTDIHALSGIRTHDPSVQASEDSSFLRPRGQRDRLGFGLMNGFIDCYTHHSQLHVITALSLIYTLYNSPFHTTHTLGFSVFTSRNLATCFNTIIIPVSLNHTLQISLYYSTLKYEYFLRSLIPFMPFLLSHLRLPSQKTPPVLIPPALGPRYLASGRPQQKTPFPNNPFIVADIFVAAGTCLPSPCLAIKILWLRYCSFQASYHNIFNGTKSAHKLSIASYLV